MATQLGRLLPRKPWFCITSVVVLSFGSPFWASLVTIEILLLEHQYKQLVLFWVGCIVDSDALHLPYHCHRISLSHHQMPFTAIIKVLVTFAANTPTFSPSSWLSASNQPTQHQMKAAKPRNHGPLQPWSRLKTITSKCHLQSCLRICQAEKRGTWEIIL